MPTVDELFPGRTSVEIDDAGGRAKPPVVPPANPPESAPPSATPPEKEEAKPGEPPPATPPQEELPEEFKGKSPVEIAKAALEAKKAAEQATQQFTQAQAQFEVLRQQVAQGLGVAPQQPKAPSKEELNARFWQDPVGVVQELMTSAAQAAVEPVANTTVAQSKEAFLGRGYSDAKTLLPEVEQMVQMASKANPVIRHDPKAYEKCYFVLKANRMEPVQVVQPPPREAALEAGAGRGAPPNKKGPSLSEEEKSEARRFDMSDEEYEKYRDIGELTWNY